MANPSLMHEMGHSKLVHWDDPEGWDGKGGGGGFGIGGTHIHPWLIHVIVWQKPPQYCKVISLQLNMYTCGGFVLMFGKTNTVFQV